MGREEQQTFDSISELMQEIVEFLEIPKREINVYVESDANSVFDSEKPLTSGGAHHLDLQPHQQPLCPRLATSSCTWTTCWKRSK
jgi:hypothetical protein